MDIDKKVQSLRTRYETGAITANEYVFKFMGLLVFAAWPLFFMGWGMWAFFNYVAGLL